jgi:hypothetical protein
MGHHFREQDIFVCRAKLASTLRRPIEENEASPGWTEMPARLKRCERGDPHDAIYGHEGQRNEEDGDDQPPLSSTPI